MNTETFENSLTKIDRRGKEKGVGHQLTDRQINKNTRQTVTKSLREHTEFKGFIGSAAYNGFHTEIRKSKTDDNIIVILTKRGTYVSNFYRCFESMKQLDQEIDSRLKEYGYNINFYHDVIEQTFIGFQLCNYHEFDNTLDAE